MEDNNKKLGFAGKMAHVFVNNARLSILLIIALFGWGVFSFFVTPKQYNPEIIKPTFQVVTEYPGATANEVEELVTKPLESKLDEMTGVDEINSRSLEGGVSMVTVGFDVGKNIEESKIKVVQKIYGNLDLKPTGVRDPIIKEINPYNVPVMTVAFYGEEYSPATLRNMVLDLKSEFEQVDNATHIEVTGGRKEEMKVLLNPRQLQAQNISLSEILATLKRNNVKLPSGHLEVGEENVAVEVDGRFKNARQVGEVVVRSEGDHLVRLSDVATVEMGPQEPEDYVKYKTRDQSTEGAVYLSVAKKKGKNIAGVVSGIEEKLQQLKEDKAIPATVKTEVVRNQGETASGEVFSLVLNLIEAILIVSLILFLFLGRRPALIVIIAIPLILFSVFGVGLLADQSINRITLFALILSLGLLVDNAIVVVENAVRAIRNAPRDGRGPNGEACLTKEAKKECVLNSVDQVGPGILMATITTILAFIPMAFVTGMMGPYMGPIPFFVPVTLIFSLFVAFTINPFLSSVLISEEEEKKEKSVTGHWAALSQRAQGRISRIHSGYKKLLYKVFKNKKLRKRILGVTFLVFFVAMLLPMVGIVKFRMLPKADKEKFFVYVDHPQGTNVDKNREVTEKIEDHLLDRKEVVSVQSFIGTPPIVDFNGLFREVQARDGEHQSTIKVNLVDTRERDISSIGLVEEMRPGLYEFLEDGYEEVDVKFVETPPGPPVRSTALLKIKGSDYEELKKISYDMEEMFEDTEGVVDVDTSRVGDMEKYTLRVDREKASRSGISAGDIAKKLNMLLDGKNVSVYHQKDNKEQEYIFLRLQKEFRNEPEDLDSIFISSPSGEKVPLSELVVKDKGGIEDVIHRQERERTVYVTGEMQDRSVTYAALESFPKLWNYDLPSGEGEVTGMSFYGMDYENKSTGEDYSISWGGEWELTVEVFRDLGAAMMVAIFLIYLVLVAQFRSFRIPVLIMATIPLAMIGVMPGFALLGYTAGTYFNATSMIGVIALAGIVVNNAILLVEYLNMFRRQGHSLEESLVEAGAVRARPIILTSLTTILGSLVMVTDRVWAGLAWSIAFGLSVSAVLTLVIFPILYYTVIGDKQEKQVESEQ